MQNFQATEHHDSDEEIIEAIKRSIGADTAPFLLTGRQVELTGFRNETSLRRDRSLGLNSLSFVRTPQGEIRYKLQDLVAAIKRMPHNGNMPTIRRKALAANLKKAHKAKAVAA